MEPDVEALGLAKPRKVTPGNEEGLLDCVLRPIQVPDDPVCDGIAAIAVEVDERREGDVVAIARLLDQPRSHGRPSRLRPVGVFASKGDLSASKVQSPRRRGQIAGR